MILTRYIGKDLLLNTVAITLVLLLIIVSGRFVGYMADAAAGEIPADLLGYLLIYTMPSLFQLVLPLGFFVAVMLVYGQLYVDSEMVVMQACGLSQTQLLIKTALLPAVLIVLIVTYVSMVIAPLSETLLRKEIEKPASTSGFSTIVAGKFQYVGAGVTVYVQSLNEEKTEMYDVFLIREDIGEDGELTKNIARSEKAYIEYRFDEVRYLVLANGYEFQTTNQSKQRTQIAFDRFAIRLPDTTRRDIKPASVDALPTAELLGSSEPKKVAALHWRLSMPLMVLISLIAAFSLSRTTHRKGRYGKLLPGILLFFLYFTGLSLIRDAMEDGKFSLVIGMWAVHGAVLAVSLMLFWSDVFTNFTKVMFRSKTSRANEVA